MTSKRGPVIDRIQKLTRRTIFQFVCCYPFDRFYIIVGGPRCILLVDFGFPIIRALSFVLLKFVTVVVEVLAPFSAMFAHAYFEASFGGTGVVCASFFGGVFRSCSSSVGVVGGQYHLHEFGGLFHH